MRQMLLALCILFTSTVAYAQDRGMVNGVLQDAIGPAKVDKPATMPLTETEQAKTDRQMMVITIAQLEGQLADRDKRIAELTKALADAEQQKDQVDANAMVLEFFKAHNVSKDDYDFVRNKDTGKWELVKKGK